MNYRFWKLAGLLLLISAHGTAQERWPSPEVEQLYTNAAGNLARGDYAGALTLCRQGLALAPGSVSFRRLQGRARYHSGDYAGADSTLSTLLAGGIEDTGSYRLVALSKAALGKIKQAQFVLSSGMGRFPTAGMLYYERGLLARMPGGEDDAGPWWLKGIGKDHSCPANFAAQALEDLASGELAWGLLYAETFLAMPHDTAGDDSMKKKLLAGWTSFFASLPAPAAKKQSEFSKAFYDIYTSLTPVMSDGVTTANLVMVRTRFIMDWLANYRGKLWHPLFDYQNELVARGKFEIYNEWLFGRAESETEYRAWNEFHPGDIARFSEWRQQHSYQPGGTDNDVRIPSDLPGIETYIK
jgi:hypothetical protein